MSLAPVGDRGQRYEVSAFGWPHPDWCVIGWVDKIDGARRMANGALLAPSCTKSKIRDRWNKDPDEILDADTTGDGS